MLSTEFEQTLRKTADKFRAQMCAKGYTLQQPFRSGEDAEGIDTVSLFEFVSRWLR